MPKVFKPQEAPEENLVSKISESGEVKTLITFEAPSRPFRKKDRSYFTTIIIFVIVVILVSLWLREFLLVAVSLSLAFVAFVFAAVPPENIIYKITTQGVTVGGSFYFWHDLDSFWFKESEGQKILIIQTKLRFPGQLVLVLGDQDEEQVKKEVAHFLPF